MASAAQTLPTIPTLGDDDVHVWHLALDPASWPRELLCGFLSTDEQIRAERFVFHSDRERFVAARGYLRLILAHYVGCLPAEIRFEYEPSGKPHAIQPTGAYALRFNLSHTRGRALCAVAWKRAVGIDIEQIRSGIDVEEIARSTFSPNERSQLAVLAPASRLEAFFACWTRKEAYLKARGDGLSYPLDAFDVLLAPGEPPALLRSREGEAEQRRWKFLALDAGMGYAAALVVEHPIADVHQFAIA